MPRHRLGSTGSVRRRGAGLGAVAAFFLVVGLLLSPIPAGAGAARPAALVPLVRPMCGTPMHLHINATPSNGTVPLTVAFQPNITGGCAPYAVEWSFGDGAQAEAFAPRHTYKSVGTFTAYAEVSGTGGGSAEDQVPIVVRGGVGNTTLRVEAVPISGVAPLAVELWANATGGNLSSGVQIQWAFGDGGHGAGTPIRYVFGHAGNFSVLATLTVANRTAANSSILISVGRPVAPPPVNLSLTAAPAIATAPAVVSFLATSNGGAANLSLELCFGVALACDLGPTGWDGTTPAPFAYLYSVPGNYSAVATLTNSTGGVVTVASAAVTILAGPPLDLAANATAPGGAAPIDATFVARVTGGTPPYSVQWTFGDGEVGASLPGVPIAHTYVRTGTFVPRVVVRDAAGQSRNASLTPITVTRGATGSGGVPSILSGTTGAELIMILVLVAAGVGVAVARWSRQRARRSRLRREGEELVREMEETNGPEP